MIFVAIPLFSESPSRHTTTKLPKKGIWTGFQEGSNVCPRLRARDPIAQHRNHYHHPAPTSSKTSCGLRIVWDDWLVLELNFERTIAVGFELRYHVDENEADANNAAALIKKATAPRKK